jgi:hypothetical protein
VLLFLNEKSIFVPMTKTKQPIVSYMEKSSYLVPAMRVVSLLADDNFMTSGTGENANPEDGYWES